MTLNSNFSLRLIFPAKPILSVTLVELCTRARNYALRMTSAPYIGELHPSLHN